MTTRLSGAGMKGTLQKVETEEDVQRLAPHNAEAERQLLGAILVNNETFYRVSDFLEPHHFFVPPHQDVYEKIGHLIRAGKTASRSPSRRFIRPTQKSQTCPRHSSCCALPAMPHPSSTRKTTAAPSMILPSAGT
jgi:hypothetical protein